MANWSEFIMNSYSISQDEFQSRLYSMSFLVTALAAQASGELVPGLQHFLLEPGTIPEIESGLFPRDGPSWTAPRKAVILALFVTTGLFGSSCAGAITKRFGALSMSITSTARKAATLFVSFAAFSDNRCTSEHAVGMAVFLTALVGKTACVKRRVDEEQATRMKRDSASASALDAEEGGTVTDVDDPLSEEPPVSGIFILEVAARRGDDGGDEEEARALIRDRCYYEVLRRHTSMLRRIRWPRLPQRVQSSATHTS